MLCRYKGEEPLEPSDHIRITTKDENGTRSTSRVFAPTSMDDTCDLRVLAKNPAGEDSATAKLKVQSAYTVDRKVDGMMGILS